MFSQEFDRSLWLMLISDKNNREDIISFIKYIPDDLYEQIYIHLDKYRNYEECNVSISNREDICLYGSCYGKYNEKYSFIVDTAQNSLTISMGIERNGTFMKAFEITLYAKSSYNSTDALDKQFLGYVVNYTDETKTEYELIDGKFGKIVVYSNNRFLKKYKKVNKNSENVELDKLFEKNGFSRTKKI